MLTSLKLLFAGLLAPALYAGVIIAFVASVVKRAEWGLYLLVILSPLPIIWYRLMGFPFGNSTLDILIFGILLGIFVNKKGFHYAPCTAPITIFMLVSYCALWNVTLRFAFPAPFTLENPALADWKNYVEMIFLYFLAYNAIESEHKQKTVVVIMATVVLLIVAREFRNFVEAASFSYEKRAMGPFWIVGLGSNHYGAFVTHFGGLLFGLFLVDKHKYRRWLYLASAALCVHSLFFSYSRGAYVAALVVVTVYGLVRKPTLLALVVSLILAWQIVLPTTVVERITMTETSSGEIEESAAMRLILWEHAIRLFQENALFGVGFNGFRYTVPQGWLTDTHNFYLKTAAEQGVIGLVVLALLLVRALASGWHLYRKGQSTFHRGLGLGFIGCTVAVTVTNLFGDRWSYFMLGAYFWVFWGLVDRARTISRERSIVISTPAVAQGHVPV